MCTGDMNQPFMQQIEGARAVFIRDNELKTLPFKRVREQRCAGIAAGEKDASGVLPAITKEPNLRIDAAVSSTDGRKKNGISRLQAPTRRIGRQSNQMVIDARHSQRLPLRQRSHL